MVKRLGCSTVLWDRVSQHRSALNCAVGETMIIPGSFGVYSFFATDYFWILSGEHDSRFKESSLQQHQNSDAARKGSTHRPRTTVVEGETKYRSWQPGKGKARVKASSALLRNPPPTTHNPQSTRFRNCSQLSETLFDRSDTSLNRYIALSKSDYRVRASINIPCRLCNRGRWLYGIYTIRRWE
ncbi:hypothetical protein J6590_056989 [Homalodisca vitripennis]|nr:hypothetical protein J6590_056989 [Homalodisca vitripennis]